MIGIIVTAAVQSSSTSTSIVVTMVGSGLLEVNVAIPIVMGANIGTSITNTLVSMSHAADRNEFRRAFAAATVHDMFNWLTVIVLLPIEALTGFLEKLTDVIMESGNWTQNKELNKSFLTVITKPLTSLIIQLDKKVLEKVAVNSTADDSLMKSCCTHNSSLQCCYLMENFGFGDTTSGILLLIFSFALLIFCVTAIVKLLRSVMKGRMAIIIRKMVNAELRKPFNFLIGYAAILVGCCVTILVQSSSIFTSVLTPLAGVGVLTTERMYPLTIGSNIGTTTTGILAAFASNPSRLRYALQIAFCHLFFNLSGIVLFYPLPFMRFPVPMAKFLGDTTATYRWFSLLYLVAMFLAIPCLIFGLSYAGSTVFVTVISLLICIALLIIVINVLQEKKPGFLPLWLQTWNWLPECMHSLDPIDRFLSQKCGFFRCCRSYISTDAQSEKDYGYKSNLSRLNILQSNSDLGGWDNSAFSCKMEAENTKL